MYAVIIMLSKKKSNIIEELSKEIDISLGNTRVYYFRELNCKKADLSFDMIRMMENIEVISVMFYQYFTTDITGILSWKNIFDFGISYRTSSSISIISLLNIGTLGFGYAYEVPTESSLSQLNLKTHELVLRINLGGDIVVTLFVS